jgi:UDP-N-acetylglucosamine diphosphorylase/glucosamine-1-phosphate N-acetyltransferase
MRMNFILFDQAREDLLPLAYTRPIAEFRCGILNLREKWEKRIPEAEFSFLTVDYLQEKYPLNHDANKNIYLSGNLLSSNDLVDYIHRLQEGQCLVDRSNEVLAIRSSRKLAHEQINTEDFELVKFEGEAKKIHFLWDIFSLNAEEIEKDFDLITKGRTSQPIDASNQLIGDRIFLEEGAIVQAAVLNSTTGPIYLGKQAEIMEGSVVRGALALCDHATLKLSTKVYGATTVGPHSKVGGEVNNSVIFGYSNKGHDGFLGNSVLGEWCNLGADTNVSNLKNNYAEIKVWNYRKGGFLNSGRQFCGLMMGDHSKAGINTMFNTATVVGVSANVFGAGFPRNFIPSFSWGGAEKWTQYRLKPAFEVAERMMERRGLELTEVDRAILTTIHELSAAYRNF